jgi:hypothetical protein
MFAVRREPSSDAATSAAVQNSLVVAAEQHLNQAQPDLPQGGGVPCIDQYDLVGPAVNTPLVVGEVHTAADMTEHFSYGNTADTHATYGEEASGELKWQIPGSVHIQNTNGSTSSTGVPWDVGAQKGEKIASYFLVGRYWYSQNKDCGAAYYQVKTIEWTAHPKSMVVVANTHNLDNHCGDDPTLKKYSTDFVYPNQKHFDRTDGKYQTFDRAFNVGGFDIGSAYSGASQYVQMHWKFLGNQKHYVLCGSNDYLTQKPLRIFAGK